VNREAIQGFFNLLEDTLKEHNLLDSPEQIYNMDESGMPLDPRPPNLIQKRGQKKVRYRVSEKKKQITILGCANALGLYGVMYSGVFCLYTIGCFTTLKKEGNLTHYPKEIYTVFI